MVLNNPNKRENQKGEAKKKIEKTRKTRARIKEKNKREQKRAREKIGEINKRGDETRNRCKTCRNTFNCIGESYPQCAIPYVLIASN